MGNGPGTGDCPYTDDGRLTTPRDGQPGRERRTATTARRPCVQGAAVRADDAAGDREADARTTLSAPAPTVGHPVEPLEDPLDVLGREPLAGVGHRRPTPHRPASKRDLDVDPPTGRRGPQGVADEVGHDLGDPVGIDQHGDRARRHPHGQGDAGVVDLRAQPLDGAGDHGTQVGHGEHQPEPALLGA